MKLNLTMNPEGKNEIRHSPRKIHKLIEAAPNHSENHGRLTINPDISHEITTEITQLKILQKERKDNAQQSLKNESSPFHIMYIEEVARLPFHQKGDPHKGELDTEIDVERIENDHNEDVNPNPEGKSAPKIKCSMKQRKVRPLLRLKVAKPAAYYAPIVDKPAKHKLHIIKCIRFLNGIGCEVLIRDTINVIYGENQRQGDNNKQNAFRWLREETKIVQVLLKIILKKVLILQNKRMVSCYLCFFVARLRCVGCLQVICFHCLCHSFFVFDWSRICGKCVCCNCD